MQHSHHGLAIFGIAAGVMASVGFLWLTGHGDLQVGIFVAAGVIATVSLLAELLWFVRIRISEHISIDDVLRRCAIESRKTRPHFMLSDTNLARAHFYMLLRSANQGRIRLFGLVEYANKVAALPKSALTSVRFTDDFKTVTDANGRSYSGLRLRQHDANATYREAIQLAICSDLFGKSTKCEFESSSWTGRN